MPPRRPLAAVAIAEGEAAAPSPRWGARVPAVHHDGAAEEVAESVHSPPQLEEQVRVLGHPVVRPAGELDVSHLPSGGLFSFLVKRAYFHGGHFFSRTDAPRWEEDRHKPSPRGRLPFWRMTSHWDVVQGCKLARRPWLARR